MNPAIPAPIFNMSDQQFFLILAVVVLVMQVMYRVWDKNDNKLVIESISKANETTLLVIKKTIDGMAPHFERSRKTYGVLQELKSMHSVRDDDGRFIWYMPKEIIETQRELVKLTHIVATTQKHMAKIMERQEGAAARGHEDIKKLLETHQEACKNQYHTIRDEMVVK